MLGLTRPGARARRRDPVLVALADAGQRFPVPMQAFGELIDGCVADVNGTFYGTFDDLRYYCRCVAGSIGRLSLGVFGAADMAVAEPLADSLGVALQLTNILRDIREDYRNGRVYLPAEDLDRFGCTLKPPAGDPDPAAEPAADAAEEARLVQVIEFEADRARDWYATGMRLLPMLDGRSAACTGAMAGIYRKLLDRIAAEPAAVLHGRLSLSAAAEGHGGRALAGPAVAAQPGRRGREDGLSAPVQPAAGPRRVVVIGGGLAGITAAIALSEAGRRGHAAGGAAAAGRRHHLVQPRRARGRHRPARVPALLHGLPRAAGPARDDRIGPHPGPVRRHRALQPDGRAQLRRNALPGPLHMGASLARYPLLSLAERARVTRAALAMRMLDPADPALDRQRLGDWLAAHGQDERTRRVLWDLFTVSSLNIDGDDASLALAATVVKTALLGKKDAADIGVPLAPLGELHGTAGLALLRRLGAEVQLGVKAAAVEVTGTGYLVRLARGDDGAGDGAGDGDEAAGDAGRDGGGPSPRTAWSSRRRRTRPPSWCRPPRACRPGRGPDLGTSPIINVHVIYDRRVTRLPFAAAVDSPVQWLFDRTEISGFGASGRGQYLAVSLSAAEPYVDVPAARLRDTFVPALAGLLPGARDARVSEFFVTRERRATFRQGPGCGRLRPQAATALPGLTLAGHGPIPDGRTRWRVRCAAD